MRKTIFILFLSLTSLNLFAIDSIPEKNLSIIQKVEHWYEQNMNYYTIT